MTVDSAGVEAGTTTTREVSAATTTRMAMIRRLDEDEEAWSRWRW